MTMRLRDKIAIVIGAGQGPGEGMGNGRATVIRFAQEGAKVMAVDRDLASAQETVKMAGGECIGGVGVAGGNFEFDERVAREAVAAVAK